MMTSEGNWLAGKALLDKSGYESVGMAPPSFELMVKKFKKAPSPAFTGNWEANAKKCSQGLTVFTSAQCPYLDDACAAAQRIAAQQGLAFKIIEPRNAAEARSLSPSPYGMFALVLDGRLFSCHYLTEKEFRERLTKCQDYGG